MEALELIRATMTEFSEAEEDTIKVFLTLAEPLVGKKRFGKFYQQALAYLTAHKMKLAGLGKQNGLGTVGDTIGISSVSEGKTSVSFSNSQAGNTALDSEYGLTVYGMQFLQLRRRCTISIIAAGGVRDGS